MVKFHAVIEINVSYGITVAALAVVIAINKENTKTKQELFFFGKKMVRGVETKEREVKCGKRKCEIAKFREQEADRIFFTNVDRL